jgi:uncharacterized membrane protein SpoIIM required for sporulation
MSDPAAMIRSARFRKEREADWVRLDRILKQTEQSGIRSLDFEDARDLSHLYRQSVASLSVAREISLDKALQDYLEALCCRAYLAVYAPQESVRGTLMRFITRSGPAAMRRSGGAILLAFMAMLIGAVVGYLLFFDDPLWYNTFVPGGLQGGRGISSSREELLGVIYGSGDEGLGGLGAFASYLFSHNTRIAIFAFALGIAACAPSFLLCAYQGLILGAFFALHVDRGIGMDLFGWLSIHGVTELAAIIIATAGGFRLGLAVLFPGNLTRRAALRKEGQDAAKLAIMAALMLVAAAILEGFGRQLIVDRDTRIIIGWGIGLLWLLYFMRAGRNQGPSR